MITCLHCGMQFREEPKGPVILGKTEAEKDAELLQKMANHLRVAHPDVLTHMGMHVAGFNGFTILCQFEIPDERIRANRTRSAAMLSQVTRRVLTDEDIEKQVDKLIGPTHPDSPHRPYETVPRYRVEELLKQMRDFLYYRDVLETPEPAAAPPEPEAPRPVQ